MRIYHLNEGIQTLSSSELQNLLESDYSEAFEQARNGNCIYKGMYLELDDQKAHQLSPIKNRKSQNTSNYYTLWINNSVEWSQYPNRNVICSTNVGTAGGYGFQTYIVLPKNGTKIGICPKLDIWVSFKFLQDISAEDMNIFFHDLFLLVYKKEPSNYQELVKMLENVKLDNKHLKSLIDEYDFDDQFLNILKNEGLLKLFATLYSPEGFDITSIKGLNRSKFSDREIWFDNEFIVIDYDNRNNLLYKDRE